MFLRLCSCGLVLLFSVVGAPAFAEVPLDFDGNGRSDFTVFRPSTGTWWINTGITVLQVRFGTAGDVPVPADYNGDGTTDVAVFRPSTSAFWIRLSPAGAVRYVPFGSPGDEPRVVADYDGDGEADVAVWRPSTAMLYVLRSSDGAGSYTPFGLTGDLPFPGLRTDLGVAAHPTVYRPSDATFYSLVNGSLLTRTIGDPATDALGLPDRFGFSGSEWAAFTRTGGQAGAWRIEGKTTFGTIEENATYGLANDLPVRGDYGADGKEDLGVVRDNGTNLVWYTAGVGGFTTMTWGLSGDIVPASSFFWR